MVSAPKPEAAPKPPVESKPDSRAVIEGLRGLAGVASGIHGITKVREVIAAITGSNLKDAKPEQCEALKAKLEGMCKNEK